MIPSFLRGGAAETREQKVKRLARKEWEKKNESANALLKGDVAFEKWFQGHSEDLTTKYSLQGKL